MPGIQTISCDQVFLDLDGVVANIEDEIAFRIERDFGYNVDPKKFLHFDISRNVDVPESWVVEQIHDPAFFLNAVPFSDAWFWCNVNFSKGLDITFLTARPATMQKVSERWLDEWEIGYSKVIAGIPRGRKMDYIKGNSIFVEDNAYEASLASEKGRTFLLDKSYNRQTDREGFERISTLFELKPVRA